MTSTSRRTLALLLSALLAVAAAPAGAATRYDRSPTRAVAKCAGGPGRVAVTVTPAGGGAYHVSVHARRLADADVQWRTTVLAYSRGDDEVTQTFLRRSVRRSWAFSTDVRLDSAPPAYVLVRTRSLGGGSTSDDTCLVGTSPDRPVGAFALCGRGIDVLTVRPQQDGSTRVTNTVYAGAPDRRWTVELDVETPGSGSASGTTDRANDHGVMRTTFDLGVGDDQPVDYSTAVFTLSAVSATGSRCWLRIVPGELASLDGARIETPRALLPR